MAELGKLDRIYHFIMKSFVRTGQAPHYIEIARALALPPEEGRELLYELIRTGIPAWLYPDSDSITSFAPFNNLPTHYRISVEGQQKWFGQ
jgi:hypothetical protein